MEEVWKKIPDMGDYEVSSLGRVKRTHFNKKTKKQRVVVIKPTTDENGYKRVTLSINGEVFNRRIHRLVAIAFIPNPCNKREVNHIDADRGNNCVENLEWCTTLENVRHCIKLGHKITFQRAVQQIKNDIIINTYQSIKEAQIAMGLKCHSNIVKCCRGVRKHSGGYEWRYADVR